MRILCLVVLITAVILVVFLVVIPAASKAPAEVVQKPLPYALNALEPVLSERQMEIHYEKHHVAYIRNLNTLNQKAPNALANGDHTTYVDLSQAIKFNGGGHLNHEFFWESLAPVADGGGDTSKGGSVIEMIEKDFGSVEQFKAHFNN